MKYTRTIYDCGCPARLDQSGELPRWCERHGLPYREDEPDPVLLIAVETGERSLWLDRLCLLVALAWLMLLMAMAWRVS